MSVAPDFSINSLVMTCLFIPREEKAEVLDVLEEKGESPKSIALERDTIKTLIENLKKD